MSQENKNKITINRQPIEVTKRRLTFYNIQQVAPLMTHGSLDFSNYWRHAFSHWLSYTDPDGRSIEIDIEGLSPEDGQTLANLLPNPNQIMEWLVFREAKSDKSSTSLTGGQ